jgi:AcrR family transcriptional regulator
MTGTPPTLLSDTPRLDGRRLRTEDSRRRVVAALLDCVRDGDFDPSAEAVAQRAGVGLRTVFRLFNDKEELFRQVTQVVLAQFADLASTPVRGETWRARLDDLMTRRFAVFEEVMPFRRAGQAHVHRSAFVRGNNEALRQTLRTSLAAVLPAAVTADSSAFDALELALSIDSWIRLRIDQQLDPARAGAAIRRIVAALTVGPSPR